jgi:hypothetical protein
MGRELLLDAFQFFGISRGNRVPNKRSLLELRSNYVKCIRRKYYSVITVIIIAVITTAGTSNRREHLVSVGLFVWPLYF